MRTLGFDPMDFPKRHSFLSLGIKRGIEFEIRDGKDPIQFREKLEDEDDMANRASGSILWSCERAKEYKDSIDSAFFEASKKREEGLSDSSSSNKLERFEQEKTGVKELYEEGRREKLADKAQFKEDLRKESEILSDLSLQLFKTTSPHKPSHWKNIIYFLGLIIIAVGEIPINYPVFQLFGEGRIATYMMALVFGAIIAMMGHTAAYLMKKSESGKPWWIATVCIFIIMFAICFVAGYFRGIFIEEVGTIKSVNPFMMAILNLLVFVAGFVWSLTMISNIPAEKMRAYSDLYYRVKTIEENIAKIDRSFEVMREKYLSNLDDVEQRKVRNLHENGQINYLESQQSLREVKNNYENVKKIYEDSNNAIKTYVDYIEKSYLEEVDLARKLRAKYFTDSIPSGVPPVLKVPEIFQRVIENFQFQTEEKENGNNFFHSVTMLLLMALLSITFVECSIPQQDKHNIAILIDRTEENQKLPTLIEAPGVLELMKVNPKEAAKSTGYGQVFFNQINSFSLNKIRKIYLSPMGEDETDVIRGQEIKKFVSFLTSELDILYQSQQGADRTSIYLPIVEAVNMMRKDALAENTIIIVSDMMENSDVNFYRLNLEAASYSKIKSKLSLIATPPDMSGFKILIIFAPRNTEDDRFFRLASRFWQVWFEELGAKVEIKGNV